MRSAIVVLFLVSACSKDSDPGDDQVGSYEARSKATEARVMLKKLSEGARAYYMDSGASMSVTPTPPQFPAPSAGPTPPLGACCKAGGKCSPDNKAWAAPTWMALQFSVDDPHYYSYEYKVGPDKKSFTARAYGDLDCDGEYSTFAIEGKAEGGASEVTATKPAE